MSYVTEENIHAVYDKLSTATENFLQAATDELLVKTDLDRKKAGALADGTIENMIDGRSNAEKREAVARELFASDYNTLDKIQDVLRQRRLRLDLARIDVEKVRMLLRLSELEAHIDRQKQ